MTTSTLRKSSRRLRGYRITLIKNGRPEALPTIWAADLPLDTWETLLKDDLVTYATMRQSGRVVLTYDRAAEQRAAAPLHSAAGKPFTLLR